MFTAYEYKLNNLILKRTNVQKDLGFIYDEKFTFNDQLDYVLSKASKKLGFVIRSTKDFRNPLSRISLYKSLIQPTMTYASCIWSPNTANGNYVLMEQILHRALRFASFKTRQPMSWISHDYSRYYMFKVATIKSVHRYNDLMVVYKVLKGYITGEELKKLFPFRQINALTRRIRLLIEKNYISHLG